MKTLTVQQPWAWAITAGYKDVENRSTLWGHRGLLGIHAGKRLSERGAEVVPRLVNEAKGGGGFTLMLGRNHYGAMVGVVTVTDSHLAEPGCCTSPWAETSYQEHSGKLRTRIAHMVLEDPVDLLHPIPCLGKLGLWTPPGDVLDQMADQLA